MERDRVFGREDLSDQVDLEPLLEDAGLDIKGQSESHFQILCPYHQNYNTTAATIAKENGFMYCFVPGCDTRLSLEDWVKDIKTMNTIQAKRYIYKFKKEARPITEVLEEIYATTDELPTFSEDTLKKMQNAYEESTEAKEYIESRGILPRSAQAFGIGYDRYKKMVVTPMRAADDKLVGVIGRSIMEKKFKNSDHLPASKTLFGINIAKRMNTDTVVICESNFDAIRVWQVGFPAVATLGGTFSDYHRTQLNKYFNKVIIGVDGDEVGLKFAQKIANKCMKSGLSVSQARWSEGELFPHGAKDFGDCTDDEILHMVRNTSLL